MAGLPDAALPRRGDAPIYPKDTEAASVADRTTKMKSMNESKPDFRKALDGVIGALGREATRQITRPYEFQLIGAITKRPN